MGPTLRVAYQVWDQYWRNAALQWSTSSWKPVMTAIVDGSSVRTAVCDAPSTSTRIGWCTLSLSEYFSADADVGRCDRDR